MSKYIWLFVRVLLIAGIVPASAGGSFQLGMQQFGILVVGSIIFSAAVGFWVYSGQDEAVNGSLPFLFLFAPVWPPARFRCSFWLLFGVVIISGAVAQLFDEPINGTSNLLASLGSLIFGMGIVLSSLLGYRIRRA